MRRWRASHSDNQPSESVPVRCARSCNCRSRKCGELFDEFVRKELRRYSELLKRNADATSQIAMVDEQLQRAEARLKVLDEQIAGHLANADRLAQALTSLLPLVEGQECPVCGRDFVRCLPSICSPTCPQKFRTWLKVLVVCRVLFVNAVMLFGFRQRVREDVKGLSVFSLNRGTDSSVIAARRTW